jgi:DNA-binding transcriptional LysR family regulator
MDLRQFETFLKIAELKSFTKAAEAVCLTQPTVSKQMVELERFFDVRLIDRTKRTVELTRAGEILLGYAKDFLNLKRETIEAIAAFKGVKKGAITVGASTIPGIYILPKVLSAFKKEYEGIQIKLIISDTKDIIDKMENGDIDIGFVGAKNDVRKIDYNKLVDDTIVLIAPPTFPDSVHPGSLKDYPLIARETGSGTRNHFETALKKTRNMGLSDLTVIAELTDTEAIKEAVKNGMGISYISKMAISEELATGKLKRLSIPGFPEIRRSFYIISRKGKTMPPQVKALMDITDKWRKHEKI